VQRAALARCRAERAHACADAARCLDVASKKLRSSARDAGLRSLESSLWGGNYRPMRDEIGPAKCIALAGCFETARFML
jgi:hypothetical protein